MPRLTLRLGTIENVDEVEVVVSKFVGGATGVWDGTSKDELIRDMSEEMKTHWKGLGVKKG